MWPRLYRTFIRYSQNKYQHKLIQNQSKRLLYRTIIFNDQSEKTKAFTEEEEEYIVQIVNKSTPEDFEKYDAKPMQIKKFLEYRRRYGKFDCFNDVLISQDVKDLIKLSKSILYGTSTSKIIKSNDNNTKIVPSLTDDFKEKINTTVGIRIWGDTICWAKLEDNSRLTEWNYVSYETASQKSLVIMINEIINIANKIPYADAYVMEADAYTSSSKMKSTVQSHYLQRQQVIATLISVLGMRRRFKESENIPDINNFFMLHPRVSARKFNLIVGGENISTDYIMSDILSGKVSKISNLRNFSIAENVRNEYLQQHTSNQYNLHLCLLIVLTFVDILLSKSDYNIGGKKKDDMDDINMEKNTANNIGQKMLNQQELHVI